MWSIILHFLAATAISQELRVKFGENQLLPFLYLPYGTWRASKYDKSADVYTFRNIRFASPPVGPMRWAEPSDPEPVIGIQDGSYGHNRIQVIPPPLANDPVYRNLTRNASEDCLFLDVYVPGKAPRKESTPVPVVTWIHGGGFTSGSKDMDLDSGLFDGTSLIKRAINGLIVVTINYCLGAFGFLAGSTLETNGSPNAGLHDQRAALQWVRSYINLLGEIRAMCLPWDNQRVAVRFYITSSPRVVT